MTPLRGRGAARNGWWVVVGGSVLLTLQNGLIMSAFGAYLVAITADTGWSPGVIAVGYAIVQLGNGFLSPLTGWCCDRFGTRAVSRLGTVGTAAGFALASAVEDATHFIGAVVVIALGCSAAGITPLTVAVVQTVKERRTLALGLLPTGVALGGLAVPLVTWALDGFGWRATFLGVAVVILVVGVLAGTVLPSDRALRPAVTPAAAEPAVLATAVADRDHDRGRDHDLGSALRTSAFWLLVVGHGSALVAVSAVNLHLVPLMTHHHGIPLATAGLTVAVMSTAQLLGQVVTGLIGDRVDQRRLAAFCMIVQTGVLVALALVSGVGLVVAAAVVHGIAWGLRGPVMTSLRTDYFGIGSFGTIMGWSMGFVSIGLVVGPLLVTALADGAGGYPGAFVALAVVTALGSVAFFVLRRPRRRMAVAVTGQDVPCSTRP
jgi:MFS family permease